MVPAGARISAGKFGRVARSLPKAAESSVKRSPMSCIPSPESPANLITTRSSVSALMSAVMSMVTVDLSFASPGSEKRSEISLHRDAERTLALTPRRGNFQTVPTGSVFVISLQSTTALRDDSTGHTDAIRRTTWAPVGNSPDASLGRLPFAAYPDAETNVSSETWARRRALRTARLSDVFATTCASISTRLAVALPA